MTNEIPKNNGGRAPKVLIVDVDYRRSGTTSIGRSDADIKAKFGYAPVHIKSGAGFKKFMEALGKRTDTQLEYGMDTIYKLNPKFADLDFIVVDTLSGLQSFVAEEIRGAKSTMLVGDWTRLKAVMDSYLVDLCNAPCHVICTAHSEIKEDQELGRRVEVPALSGKSGSQLGKYFDNILYSNVATDKLGKRAYTWQSAPSERRDCRGLPSVTERALQHGGFIPQDFVELYKTIHQDTTEPVTTLLLGPFGSGKSYSIRTLADLRL